MAFIWMLPDIFNNIKVIYLAKNITNILYFLFESHIRS
uniref:Uncharacterized protein n=1 Tax=Podoviridae sp. ct8Lf7 TaxID=2827723 RepID=A0A8S5S153_9CAUD|nr:MAG TPA: hypothetical protein [Podoviridae sp. ct8Lf7]